MLPKWMDKQEKRLQNRHSKEQEKRLARQVGGRVQAGSGSSWRAPQDIKSPEYMIQAKYTGKSEYPLKASDLIQVAVDANRCGRTPVMIVEFTAYRKRAVILIEEM